MGFFSWNCVACNKAFISACNFDEKTKWAAEVTVALYCKAYRSTPATIIHGIYDGYGDVGSGEFNFLDWDTSQYPDYRAFHTTCWELLDEPELVKDLSFYKPNQSADNQGYFLSESEWVDLEDQPRLILH